MTEPPNRGARAGYLMEHVGEGARLVRKSDDETALRHLRLVGLAEGMSVLDVGAGPGAVTRLMANLVGPAGSAVGLDISEERIALGKQLLRELPNVKMLVGDLHDPPFADASFDMVWSRFVFSYLPEPGVAACRLAKLLRPGGKLVSIDIDGNGLWHYPLSPALEQGIAILEACFSSRFDPWVGRKLFHFTRMAGLSNLKVHVFPYHLYAGSAPQEAIDNWDEKLSTIAPLATRAFGGAARFERFHRAFLDHLASPETFTYSTLHIAEGTRSVSDVG